MPYSRNYLCATLSPPLFLHSIYVLSCENISHTRPSTRLVTLHLLTLFPAPCSMLHAPSSSFLPQLASLAHLVSTLQQSSLLFIFIFG